MIPTSTVSARVADCDTAPPACLDAIRISGEGYRLQIAHLENALKEREEELRIRTASTAFEGVAPCAERAPSGFRFETVLLTGTVGVVIGAALTILFVVSHH